MAKTCLVKRIDQSDCINVSAGYQDQNHPRSRPEGNINCSPTGCKYRFCAAVTSAYDQPMAIKGQLAGAESLRVGRSNLVPQTRGLCPICSSGTGEF